MICLSVDHLHDAYVGQKEKPTAMLSFFGVFVCETRDDGKYKKLKEGGARDLRDTLASSNRESLVLVAEY